ncbi:MAG: YihY/virulence factor BrkB family protein [Verrucomicrobiae bacterium]|nr:YihY/virulence factor BrkB family protein [Verrucomicrobiae bacterium]
MIIPTMTEPERSQNAGGRNASSPSEIPRSGWLDVAVRLWRSIKTHELSLISAGVAYFAFTGFFPALAALVSIYGLVSDPIEIETSLDFAESAMPHEVKELIQREMIRFTDNRVAGPAAIIASLIAIWGGAKSMVAFMKGLNIVYGETENRGIIRTRLVALGLTAGAILFTAILIGLLAVVPPVLKNFVDESWVKSGINLLRWPLLFVVITFALSVLYRFGPNRADARWQWISAGACLGAVLILILSLSFSLFLSRVADYSKTYGSLGAVIALLLWFYFTATSVLIGGGLNAQLELQTRKDSTTGPPQPMGDRGAFVADNLGASRKNAPADDS